MVRIPLNKGMTVRVMNTTIIDTIHAVDKESWNNLPGGPFFSYEWFAYIEAIEGPRLRPFYLLCYDNNLLKGALPVFCPTLRDNIFNKILFGRYKILMNISDLLVGKVMLCFSPKAGEDIFRGYHLDSAVFDSLRRGIEVLAQRLELSTIAFMGVHETSLAEIKWLEGCGYKKVLLNCVGILEGEFQEFNDYLLSLSPVKRKAVKQDIRKFKKSGFVLEAVDDPLAITEKIHELTMNVCHQHNFTPTDFNKHSLASSFEFMQDYMQTFVIRKSGKVISTHTILEKNGIIDSHALGLDYKELGDSRSYFYLFFYNTIKEMIKRNARYINFFQMAYKTKERRGCRLIKQYMLVKSLKGNRILDKWIGFAHRRYEHKFRSDYQTGR